MSEHKLGMSCGNKFGSACKSMNLPETNLKSYSRGCLSSSVLLSVNICFKSTFLSTTFLCNKLREKLLSSEWTLSLELHLTPAQMSCIRATTAKNLMEPDQRPEAIITHMMVAWPPNVMRQKFAANCLINFTSLSLRKSEASSGGSSRHVLLYSGETKSETSQESIFRSNSVLSNYIRN